MALPKSELAKYRAQLLKDRQTEQRYLAAKDFARSLIEMGRDTSSPDALAVLAVKYADALLNELG